MAEDTRVINGRISAETHLKAKIQAAKENITIMKLTEKALNAYIKEAEETEKSGE